MSAYKPGSVQQWTPLSSEEDKQTAFNNLSKQVVINDFKDTKTNERIDSLTKIIDIPEFSDTKLQFVFDPYTVNKTVSFNYDWTDAWMSMDSMYIRDVLDPVNAQDAATKSYVDTAVAGAGSGGTPSALENGTYSTTRVETESRFGGNGQNIAMIVDNQPIFTGGLDTEGWESGSVEVKGMIDLSGEGNFAGNVNLVGGFATTFGNAVLEDQWGYTSAAKTITGNGYSADIGISGGWEGGFLHRDATAAEQQAVNAIRGGTTYINGFNGGGIDIGAYLQSTDFTGAPTDIASRGGYLKANIEGKMTLSSPEIKIGSFGNRASSDVAGTIHIGNTNSTSVTIESQKISMSNKTVQDVADPVNAQDAATKAYVDANAGGSSGPFTQNGVEYETSATLRTDGDSAFEMKGAGGLQIWGSSSLTMLSGSYTDFGSTTLARVGEPTQTHHAATKNYVDTEIAKVPTSPFADVGGIPTASGTIKAATLELSGDFKVPNGMTTLGSGGLTVADGDVAFNDGAITFSNNIDVTFTAAPITLDADTSFYTNANTDLVFGGARLKGVGEPTAGNDAATKSYVDTAVAGAGGGGSAPSFLSPFHIGEFECAAIDGNPGSGVAAKTFVVDSAGGGISEMYIMGEGIDFQIVANAFTNQNCKLSFVFIKVGETSNTNYRQVEGSAQGFSTFTGLTVGNVNGASSGGFLNLEAGVKYNVYLLQLGGTLIN